MKLNLRTVRAGVRCITGVTFLFSAALAYGDALVDINRDFKWVDLSNCPPAYSRQGRSAYTVGLHLPSQGDGWRDTR